MWHHHKLFQQWSYLNVLATFNFLGHNRLVCLWINLRHKETGFLSGCSSRFS